LSAARVGELELDGELVKRASLEPPSEHGELVFGEAIARVLEDLRRLTLVLESR
jgi:hypothetical protein